MLERVGTGWTGVGPVLGRVALVSDPRWTGIGLRDRRLIGIGLGDRCWVGVGLSVYDDLHVGRVGPVLDRCWTADVID